MKKSIILLLSALTLATVFTSCTKDDSGPVDMNFIEGKWNFSRSTATSGSFTLPYSTDYFKNEDGCNKDYIEIMSGGIVKYTDYSLNCVLIQKTGTWSQSGNTITIAVTGTSFNDTFDVTTLTSSELVLKINGTYEGLSGTLNMYFTK